MMKSKLPKIRERHVSELLEAVFLLCALDTSLTSEVIDKLSARAKRVAFRRVGSVAVRQKKGVDFDVLGHVIYLWQRTPEYLDELGLPRPIRASGRAPSIQALFADIKRREYFEQGVKDLVRLGRIRRLSAERFVPCSEVTIVPGLSPEFVELLGQTINRLVATVMHNTSQKDASSVKLVERVTAIPDLPAKQVRAFKLFAREQGGALINTMNEWLESRRGSRKARAPKTASHVTAGLHVFAFVDKQGR
jgi:hypothetical protein